MHGRNSLMINNASGTMCCALRTIRYILRQQCIKTLLIKNRKSIGRDRLIKYIPRSMVKSISLPSDTDCEGVFLWKFLHILRSNIGLRTWLVVCKDRILMRSDNMVLILIDIDIDGCDRYRWHRLYSIRNMWIAPHLLGRSGVPRSLFTLTMSIADQNTVPSRC